ncbi:MAG TPA: DUF6029 family protein, partial [archaeon]|nr:DUF6029 family protein [archaeon]
LVIDRHVLAALNIEYEPADGVTLGLNALHDRLTNRKDHKSADHVELEADIPTWIGGAFLGLTARQWEFFLEFSSKHTGYNRLSPQADDFYQLPIRMLSLERDVTGKGLYWSLGYSEKGYGFSLQYKNYQYNLARDFGSMVSSALDPASVLPYQNPPTVIKEHIYFLLKRFPLTPDPNNEVGFELEFNAQPTGSLALQASASVNSMADILLPVPGGRDSERHRGGFPLAPHLGTAYNPTYDSFIELRWRKGQRFQLNGGAGFRKITDYYVRGRYGDHTYIWTFPVEARLRWSRRFSTVLNLETQHVRDKTFPLALLGQTYWNNYIALSLSWAPVFSVTLSSEFTGEENELDKTQCWPLLATSLRLRKWGTLDLSYGKQRAGMVCSNGLCRYVPGFKGLRAELSMFF